MNADALCCATDILADVNEPFGIFLRLHVAEQLSGRTSPEIL
jgi:hypothetical protein